MNKTELYVQLFRNHHILHFNKELVVTNKFYRDFSLDEIVAGSADTTIVARQVPSLTPTLKEKSVTLPSNAAVDGHPNFKQFILDSDIPGKLELSNGSHYWANKYNIQADKEYKKIMKRPGIRYDVLVTATKLYYKAGGARETISNFILNGSWESFYDSMEANLDKGTAEQHIKKNLSEGDQGHSRYR